LPVRIYSLAKELKIDSKELVELCTKAGLSGKASPLASLADDEVVRLKEFLANRASRPASGGPPAPMPVRSPKPAPIAAPPRLSTKAPTKAPVAPASATPPPPTIVEPDVIRREDYIAPGGVSARAPVTEIKAERPSGESRKKSIDGEGGKPPSRAATTIKLAPMPQSVLPPPKPAERELAPQKPDLKLPVDAIRAGRSGAKPLSEHIKKHEQKRKAEGRPGDRGGPGGPPIPQVPPAEETGRERSRRGPRPAAAKAAGSPDEFASALGGREARQLIRKRTAAPARKPGMGEDEEPVVSHRRALTRLKRTGKGSTAAPRKGKVVLQLPATVRSFSEAAGVTASQVLRKLIDIGFELGKTTISTAIDQETVEMLAVELGVEVDLRQAVSLEDQLLTVLDMRADPPETLKPRPPVITFLGHVDHGKTSLLDKIIGIDVASGESGGITQHIRAYEIEKSGRQISFVDTPGHEAFTEMRARGANVTDIAVLVVAADDGVMPQTEEAISHARAANVPIVVALNKIDLPGVDIQRIFQQLATAGLLPTEWGGDVEVIKTSAHTGQGLDDLLETLFTIAELHDLKANPDRTAVGTCLEASVHEGRGVVAKMIVQKGTLRVGDAIVCGTATGHVKAMYDTLDTNRRVPTAGPSTPVNLTGLDTPPQAGERFYVLQDIAQARQIAEKRRQDSRQSTLGTAPTHVTLETLFDKLGEDEVKQFNMILRADTRGSIEAIQKELTKLEHPEVKIKVLQATVGGVSEADVHLADASDAVIFGFNVVPDEKARQLADNRKIQIRRYEIIYKLTEDLRAALEGMLTPERREAELGRVIVQRTFTNSRIGTIAGCRVLAGTIPRNGRMRVIRDSRVIGDYPVESLRREKEDVREVREGFECGIKLAGFNDVKEGDVLEAYKIEEVARTF
jgi:translation initiation factor IF-2